MPLSHVESKEAVSKNIKTEMSAEKSQDQAVAIALNTAREAGAHIPKKHMAEGGVSDTKAEKMPDLEESAESFDKGMDKANERHDSDAMRSYLASKFQLSQPEDDSVKMAE